MKQKSSRLAHFFFYLSHNGDLLLEKSTSVHIPFQGEIDRKLSIDIVKLKNRSRLK